MSHSRHTLTNILFAAFIITLLLLSFFSYQRSLRQAAASDWVTHSQSVKLELEETYNLVTTAETSQRGFLLTKDSIFLRHFDKSKTLLTNNLIDIRKLVADNPEQIANIDTTADVCYKRIRWLQFVVDSFSSLSEQQRQSMFIRGQALTDTLRAYINKMKAVESTLLTQRLADKQKEQAATAATILLFSIVAIVFLAAAYFGIKRQTNISTLLDREVQKQTQEIKQANIFLAEKNKELEQSNAELNSFSFVASHDLKEPLRKIEMYTNRISTQDEANLSEKTKVYLQKMKETTRRMQDLLSDIFMYAQTDKKDISEKTDLSKIAERAISTLQEVIDEKQATIEYNDLPTVHAIPYQMEQLFTNLMSNSLKYAKADEKPFIEIKAEQITGNANNGAWKISFTDNGIGFDEAYKHKVFEVFQRLHTKNEYSGTGIGLAICKKIAENHGGRIDASSVPGKGSVFTLILPQ